ncbi:hypothetical protein AX17_004711 [Amanita inopinata Kibby_2008]|nr:hypothetical protein AX17_004711 [Amanita inopinata Kibby_2008]
MPGSSPMQSDRIYNVTQLISPPPEETLRRASRQMTFTPSLLAEPPSNTSKRKRRTQPTTPMKQELTPNPKPRKQAKPFTVVDPESPTRSAFQPFDANTATPTKSKRVTILSPHADNPQANYFPPIDARAPGSTRARRTVTPVPFYEPPSVVFTPPREVMATPVLSKSSKRKSGTKSRPKPTSLMIMPVKKELPDIDLNAPMPPPSPSDDPILLSGPPTSTPSRRSGRNRRSAEHLPLHTVSTQADVIPIANHLPSHNTNSDMPDSETPEYYDWVPHSRPLEHSSSMDSSSMLDLNLSDADVPPVDLPVFSLNDLPPSSDDWSDDDDDGDGDAIGTLDADAIEEGQGEYTGRWRTLLVKTKQDPPSSVTRTRMEQWGRPVSPFPEEAKSFESCTFDGGIEEADLSTAQNDEELNQDQQDELEEEEVRQMSTEPDNEEIGHVDVCLESLSLEDGGPGPSNIMSLASSSPSPADHFDLFPHRDALVAAIGEEVSVPLPPNDEDRSSDEETDVSFVKISSADPRAAARAAAILKQYDYDCFTEISGSKHRRLSRDKLSRDTGPGRALARKGVLDGRITKDRSKRRSSTGTGVLGNQVFISGSPITTLPNLLREAEAEVSFTHPSQSAAGELYETPLPVRYTPLNAFDVPSFTERRWAKDDWKMLDACFTDERLCVGNKPGAGSGGLADVELVEIDNVVQRYIDLLGGEGLFLRFGPDWNRELILQRARALRRRQQSGKVAPPTSPSQPTMRSIQFTGSSISDMEVPDFTPLKERAASRRQARPLFPPPNLCGAPFQEDLSEGMREFKELPPSLLAPRYAHLLEGGGTAGVDETDKSEPVAFTEDEFPDLVDKSAIEEAMSFTERDSFTLPQETPTTLGRRVKGFLFSYLPSLPKTEPPPARRGISAPRQPGLPLPPPDILEKQRGPIATPARLPLPKTKHPKELVKLHPVPAEPRKTSLIPRFMKPQRLVQLHPAPSTQRVQKPVPVIRPRSSNGSVKDLVKSFEEFRNINEREMSKVGHDRQESKESKPVWRP